MCAGHCLLDRGDRARISDRPRGERRIARQQLHQLHDELGIRDELDRIETEQRYFAEVKAHAAAPRVLSTCCRAKTGGFPLALRGDTQFGDLAPGDHRLGKKRSIVG